MATSKLSLNAESGSDKFDWLIFKVRHPNTLPSPSPTETMHVIKLDWQKQQCRIVWSRAMMGRMECLAWIDDSFLQVEFSNSNFSSTLGNLPVQTSAVKWIVKNFNKKAPLAESAIAAKRRALAARYHHMPPRRPFVPNSNFKSSNSNSNLNSTMYSNHSQGRWQLQSWAWMQSQDQINLID